MRILYCTSNVSNADSDGGALESAIVKGLVRAGDELEVLVLVEDETQSAAELPSHSTVAIEVHVADESDLPDAATRKFAWVVSSRFKEKNFDAVVARGMVLNRTLVGQEKLAARLWSLLPAAELDARLEAGKEGLSYLQAIVKHNKLTLVERGDQRQAIQRAVPTAHHRIVNVGGSGLASENAETPTPLRSLSNMWNAQRRVLFYRDSGVGDQKGWASSTYRAACSMARADMHVVIMCHDGLSIFGSAETSGNPHVTVIEPVSAGHQITEGRLQPRFAAWHVAVAAMQLDCAVVLSDDLKTVRFGFTNSSVRGRLWPVIQFDGLVDFDIHRQAIEQLSKWVSRLILISDESRAVLESRIPSATSKTILLPGMWTSGSDAPLVSDRETHLGALLKKHLDRFVPDYVSNPRLSAARHVLMAGHDFKFAGELLDVLARREDVELRTDHWTAQNAQDEPLSRTLLDWADVIFCEFASHNAVWYSWEKKPGQTLIVRFHGYELWSPWIQDVNLANVDKFVFVSEFYRDKVVDELGWPREKTAVIPNVVDVLDLSRPKRNNARFHIGIVGIVPILKRPDRALDLLERLLAADERYTLHIRGRAPWEYGWMWKDDDIRDAYEAFYERLASNPNLRRRVSFEDFGPDMGCWFQKIGWMLSPSFRETFHLAPVEGMASGAVPVVWDREGAEEIFGGDWVHGDTDSAADYIIKANEDAATYAGLSRAAQDQAMRFDVVENGREWIRLIFATESAYSDVPAENVQADRFEEIFAASSDAASFARLMSVLLRDADTQRIQEMTLAHPELTSDLPPHILWKVGVEALKADRLQIPERTLGAAYLVRQNTVLYSIDTMRTREPGFSLPTGCHAEIGGDALRLVAVASSAIDPHCDSEGEARGSIDIDGALAVQLPLLHTNRLRVDKFIIAAADALVREARVLRPAAIASHGDFWISLPALIAARRLGIPFLAENQSMPSGRDDADLSRLVRSESDAVFSSDTSPMACLKQGIRSYSGAIDRTAQRELSTLKVGVIADQFTSLTIAHSFETVPLSRADGYLQVSSLDLDAIFVESAWEGPNDEWRRGVAYYPDRIDDLQRIIKVANARGIPVVFWNKEDPVHFRAFERTAGMMDHVFTTDADMVGKYLQNPVSVVKTVSSLPFYAEPAIHNPLPTDRPYNHSVSYAGTYYGDRFKERSVELHRILDAAKKHGLTIYDRQVNVPNSPYAFPPELADFVREGVPYDEVLKVYKAHPVNINVNSANDSPTMFSRRVVEIAASGSVVLSGRGRGITEQIQGIEATDSDARWAELLAVWMTDESHRLDEVWQQMRTITRSHLAEQALTILMRTAGIPVAARELPAYAITAGKLESDDVDAILRQTWLPAVVCSDYLATYDSDRLQGHGIHVAATSEQCDSEAEWFASWSNVPFDTYFEDLLHATRFGNWDVLAGRPYQESDGMGQPIIELKRSGTFAEIRRHGLGLESSAKAPLTWVVVQA